MVELGTSTSPSSTCLPLRILANRFRSGGPRIHFEQKTHFQENDISTIANLISVVVHKSINSRCRFRDTQFHGTLPTWGTQDLCKLCGCCLANQTQSCVSLQCGWVRSKNTHQRNVRSNEIRPRLHLNGEHCNREDPCIQLKYWTKHATSDNHNEIKGGPIDKEPIYYTQVT